jgi:hypothetical protein
MKKWTFQIFENKRILFCIFFFWKLMQKRYINWWVWSFSKQIKIHFFYILKWYLFIFLKIFVFSTSSIWILFYAFLLRANVFVNKTMFSKLVEYFLFSFWSGLKKMNLYLFFFKIDIFINHISFYGSISLYFFINRNIRYYLFRYFL